jgi:transposase
MIRSTKVSLKFANSSKLEILQTYLKEYNKVVQLIAEILWDFDKIPSLMNSEISNKIKEQTFLSSRMIQAAGKQASSVVRGTKKKHSKRIWMINKLKEQGKFKKARKLEAITAARNPSSPKFLKEIPMVLDSRFIAISLESKTPTFDGWLTFHSGTRIKLEIPFKRTKHLNKLLSSGFVLKEGSASISGKNITLFFEKEESESKGTLTAGIDVGIKTCLSLADGKNEPSGTPVDNHGWTLEKINLTLCRKKKGSKGFLKAQNHRHNFIGWSVNQLPWDSFKELKIENIKYLGKYKRLPRYLKHFTYSEIFDRLEQRAEVQGVLVTKVSPTYTSQRCSKCSWTRKSNRKGKQFRCTSCGHTEDADLNAARNIRLDLKPVGKKERLERKNLKGFFWESESPGQEPVVPAVREINSDGL